MILNRCYVGSASGQPTNKKIIKAIVKRAARNFDRFPCCSFSLHCFIM